MNSNDFFMYNVDGGFVNQQILYRIIRTRNRKMNLHDFTGLLWMPN